MSDYDSGPARSSGPTRKIKPAGWILLLLLLGGAGWLVWTKVVPLVQHRPGAPQPTPAEPPPTPVEPPPTPTAPPRTDVPPPGTKTLEAALFPRVVEPLPQVKGVTRTLALPPLAGVDVNVPGAVKAKSEVDAVRLVARGEADAAITTVPALAAAPEAIASGVRAVWALAPSLREATLFPSCAPDALVRARLGAERGSLGQFHLLRALAGQPLPEVLLFDTPAELWRAVGDGAVSGGAVRQGEANDVAKPACRVLPESAFTLVIVHRVAQPLSAAELAAIAALSKHPALAPEEVAAFFDPARTAPGGFTELFDAASAVWTRVGVTEKAAHAKDAVDRTFVTTGEPAPAAEPSTPATVPSTTTERGYPSWPDRR